ncbi:Retrovirus-related Pol polyprotein from transposon TNT 1-94 [Vitis vinifera]|uniref:Retrovirus-related Pol polyprotein from transposon TNT 1-94 n=1 Tax=Vitis vinifera TaxID=29760 RepID=A0A438CBW7_VITVI|nr:Retrovirus-related Pol polyprotein from transposon TNT 1-94 [Vitis vinifera]
MGATTHISVTMQGCLRSQMPTDGERYIYVGNGNKSQSLDVFKNFKAEVENQLNKKIKAVRFDRGGEYYGRYDGSGEQRPGQFAKYLMECGIIPQYTMPGTPSQNGVAERQNRTLKDMSTKQSSSQTPYELWTSKKPNIRHLHVWGCPIEARPYKPNEKKLDSRTVSCYCVGYSERSRGFKFYDSLTRSFFETGNAKFIEDVELSGREPSRKVVFEEESVNIPIITTGHGHIMFDDTIQNVQSITGI